MKLTVNMKSSLLLFSILFASVSLIITTLIVFPTNVYNRLSATLVCSVILYISWHLSNFVWNKVTLIPKQLVNANGKAILITGCDTGFGHILAKRLNEYGFYVFAACLFPEGEGASKLRDLCDHNLRIIKLDVTKEEDVNAALEEVKLSIGDKQLWAIVNNAGILISAEIEMGDIECFKSQIDVNCLGIIRVSKAFIPLLRQSKGRVVNMASLAGRFSIPGMVAYCVSKAGVISFSDGLRREMKKWNIDVITIEPHLFRTNLCDQQSQQTLLLKAWNSSSEDVKLNYGEQYFAGFQLVLQKMLQSARPRVQDVVDTMYIAVTHRFVSSNYIVLGDIERLRVALWSLLPTRLVDYIGNWLYLYYTGKPTALISENKKKIK